MAIDDLRRPTWACRYAQRSHQLRQRLGPQLLATGRHSLSMLAGSASQSQWLPLSVSVTLCVRFLLKEKKTPKVDSPVR